MWALDVLWFVCWLVCAGVFGWTLRESIGFPIYFATRMHRAKATAALETRAAEDDAAEDMKAFGKEHPELERTYRGVPLTRVNEFCKQERRKMVSNQLPVGWAYKDEKCAQQTKTQQ